MDQAEYERSYRLETDHWWFVSRQRLVTALLEAYVKPTAQERLLDVGCGTGGNLAALQQWGWVTGLDLHPLPLHLARGRQLNRLAQASVLSLPYADNLFGVVTAFDVLSHRWVTNDEQAIREIYRVLRPGGWLMATDAAMPLLWSAHDVAYMARCRYKLDDFSHTLQQAGFDLDLCSYFNLVLLPIIAPLKLMMRWWPLPEDLVLRPAPAWLNRWLIGWRDLELSWLRRRRGLPAGSSLLCLARKPFTGI